MDVCADSEEEEEEEEEDVVDIPMFNGSDQSDQ